MRTIPDWRGLALFALLGLAVALLTLYLSHGTRMVTVF